MKPRISAALASLILLQSCALEHGPASKISEFPSFPPPPQSPQIIALGQINSGRQPTAAQQKVSEFLFGAEPEAGLSLIKPVSLAWGSGSLFICDSALAGVLKWAPAARELSAQNWDSQPQRPVVIRMAQNGDFLVVDIAESAVVRYSNHGKLLNRYATSDRGFRPAGVAEIKKEIWITDSIGHRILVFDADRATLKREIGKRGPGPGEFGAPLGLASTPDGNVCVVDTLNDRVQLLDSDGNWLRDIGGLGNCVGRFGRPKDVAVGRDGTIFVTDAPSQRVHAFDAAGRPLLAFGEPQSGNAGLSIPAGICICAENPMPDSELPDDFKADYFVAVAEQLRHPGIRVYAWRRKTAGQPVTLRQGTSFVARPEGTSPSPHWSSSHCGDCHKMDASRALPIELAHVDDLCLSCHDGKKASSEPHPIGRLANSGGKGPPTQWPLVDEKIGCLTCHNIRDHCDPATSRPTINPTMLRGIDSGQPANFCSHCHDPENFQRLNPHQQIGLGGSVNDKSCIVCHNRSPAIPAQGARTGASDLRAAGSSVCMTCHGKHWDVSERGHVDRPATAVITSNMNANVKPTQRGALPLSTEGRVTCFSCHNPHQQGLFPKESSLGAIASDPIDAKAFLRVNFSELCIYCHAK